MRPSSIHAGMVVALLAMGGCASGYTDAPGSWGTRGASDDTFVEVRNDNWLDMRVYAYAGSRKHRLGVVSSLSSERFKIPTDIMAAGYNVRFVLDPIGGGREYSTETLIVNPGVTVDLRVANQITLTSWSVHH